MDEPPRSPALAEMIRAVSSGITPITIEEVRARVDQQTGDRRPEQITDPAPSIRAPVADEVEVVDLMVRADEIQQSRSWPSRTLVTVGAAVLVIGVGALLGIGLIARQDPARTEGTNDLSPPTSVPSTAPQPSVEQDAEAVARQFIEALNRYDNTAIDELLAPGADINEIPAGPIDDYSDLVELYEILNWEFTLTGCEETTSALACTYRASNAWSEALGHQAQRTGTFRFTATDGRLRVIQNSFNWQDWSNPVMTVFVSWVRFNHPDAAEVIWPNRSASMSLTPESLDLIRDLTAEFVAEQDE